MSVQIKQFGTTRAGEPVQVAVLKNEHLEAHILSYAAAIQRLIVPDRSGKPVDVVLLGYRRCLEGLRWRRTAYTIHLPAVLFFMLTPGAGRGGRS